jgi:hypothetical protein
MSTHYEKQLSVITPVPCKSVGTKWVWLIPHRTVILTNLGSRECNVMWMWAFVMTAWLMVKTLPALASESLYTVPWLTHQLWWRKAPQKVCWNVGLLVLVLTLLVFLPIFMVTMPHSLERGHISELDHESPFPQIISFYYNNKLLYVIENAMYIVKINDQ